MAMRGVNVFQIGDLRVTPDDADLRGGWRVEEDGAVVARGMTHGEATFWAVRTHNVTLAARIQERIAGSTLDSTTTTRRLEAALAALEERRSKAG
ncbi:hypothetical protein [Paludisphaera mucosa]|uniref:Uncharacterized protein n=1 Tax=Paludisphaera mucosa TaxID=3030827 RepID=A0ABT6F6S2_9BACT|nr:hypothetical protein [Paludisphaera mucosa]MDG3003275.1 hypothetical protein [Paludisphaera mucosa]